MIAADLLKLRNCWSANKTLFSSVEECLHILFETDKAKRFTCAKGHVLGQNRTFPLRVSNLMCWPRAQITRQQHF